MQRAIVVSTTITLLASCGGTPQEFGNTHDLGVALTKGGMRCEIEEVDDFDPDVFLFMPEEARDIIEAGERLEDEYNMQYDICELPEKESALVATFESDDDRDRLLDEASDGESVYVIGPRWIVTVDSIPTAEKMQDIIGGDIRE